MSFPECGICDGMRICKCYSEEIDKRFIAACHAIGGILATNANISDRQIALSAIAVADALIAELEKK